MGLEKASLVAVTSIDRRAGACTARKRRDDEPRPELGAKLKKLRLERRLSIVAAAQATGVSKTHLWNLENREVNPSRELLIKLATVYGVGAVDLVDLGVETPVEEPEMAALFRDMKGLSARDLETIRTLVKQFKSK